MATVIDSLVIELGLDPSKFTKGQREAFDALRKMQDEAEKANNKAKAGFDLLDVSLSKLTSSALKFGGALLGARGFEDLIVKITAMNNELGRTAEILGVNNEELSKWQNIAERAGGSKQEMSETFGNITRNISQVNVTGPNTDFFQWLRKLGVNYRQFVDPKGQVNNMTGLLEAISGGMQNLPAGERQLASQALGLGQQNQLLFGQGPAQIQEQLKQQERIKVTTDAQVENARKLVSQWEELKQAIEQAANSVEENFHGAISDTLESMNSLLDVVNNKGDKKSSDRFWKPWTDPESNKDPLFKFLYETFFKKSSGGRGNTQFGPFLPTSTSEPNVKEGANLPLGLYAVASSLTGIPGFQVTGGKDTYHAGFASAHNKGLAMDFTIGNAANAAKLETMINAKFKELGIDAKAINEYDPLKRSPMSNGPHMHLGFKSQEALSQFNAAKAGGKIEFNIDTLNVRADDPQGLANGVVGASRVQGAVKNRGQAVNSNGGFQ